MGTYNYACPENAVFKHWILDVVPYDVPHFDFLNIGVSGFFGVGFSWGNTKEDAIIKIFTEYVGAPSKNMAKFNNNIYAQQTREHFNALIA